ncbi:EamA family transporter, partial [Acinetobacter baumannii]|nr:EamA family transporter [Acinetobacter baumannii]
ISTHANDCMELPSIFLCLAKSLEYAGIVKTEIAQRLSVVLSLLAAYFFFQEQFNSLKLLGIGLGVWFGYAAVDILLKYTSSLGLQFTLTLN